MRSQPVAADSSAERMYHERYERCAAERDALTRQWNLLANMRLVAFVGSALLVWWAIASRQPVVGVLGVVSIAGFVVLVARHRLVGAVRTRAIIMADLNHEGLLRVRRDWQALPLSSDREPDPNHPYDADLDVTGRASLMHLLETVTSPPGSTTLRSWLLGPTPVAKILERQGAAAELAPKLDLRQEFACAGRDTQRFADPDRFLAWAEGDRWYAARAWLPWVARVLTATFILGAIAQITGIIAFPIWLPVLMLNLALAGTIGAAVPSIIGRVRTQQGTLQRYAGQLDQITSWPAESAGLQSVQRQIAASGQPAATALRSLDRRLSWVVPPGSLAYVPLQAAFLWDIHVLDALERWQHRNGEHVRGWLEALGEADAIAALAGLAGDNPAWCFPDVDPAARSLIATGLGHPLISETVRVPNDVEIGPDGTFLLITGSNMSGKSTLLRAVGVNAILAGAGGPVCASSLRMPPVDVWTSVRITDSLAAGVSFFMAELLRLKAVVDGADQHDSQTTGRRFLYLLDEILQGTNTTERRTAARRIIARLVASGALGAVTTHDLDLADSAELASAAIPVHFREMFVDGPDGPEMRFDHVMRPGIATTTNALQLMEAIGLAVPQDTAVRQKAAGGRTKE